MFKKKVLINASNLHSGGAIAVATSFIKELIHLNPDDLSVSLLISTSVSGNLASLNVDLSSLKKVVIKDYYGISALWSGLCDDLTGYDAVFTIFGPAYTLKNIPNHLVGFAQPNIIYPNNPVLESYTTFVRWKTRLKYRFQELFFSNSTQLVVELEHVKKGIESRGFFSKKPISIVNSAVDSVFNMPLKWERVSFSVNKRSLNLGIISRNYPHKNLRILPDVKHLLYEKYGINATFYVTFLDQEFESCSDGFKKEIVNVGPLKLAQCPSFYNKMDAVVFPSLLECFSAVPIEAMMIKKPLFASDLPFIRDCCHDHANYFEPLNAESIASSIASFFAKSEAERAQFIKDANAFVLTYPGPDKRALSYLEIIRSL